MTSLNPQKYRSYCYFELVKKMYNIYYDKSSINKLLWPIGFMEDSMETHGSHVHCPIP